MTLQEAKDQVAKSRAYENWHKMEILEHQINSGSWQFLLKATEEAAELYARSKWDEACEACAELACVDNIGTDGEAYILNHKPEFKI